MAESKDRFEALRSNLLDPNGHAALARRVSPALAHVLQRIAESTSSEEWAEFAAEGFSLEALPPIVLGRREMECLRGGIQTADVDALFRNDT